MTNEELTTGLRHIAHTMERNGHSYYQHVAETAIQALSRQSFINKPCISEGVCREDKIQVLDKIRAEIERRKKNSGGEPSRDLAFNVCLQIIDKYKAESEVEE